MITARQYAEIHGTPYTTVATWLQRELIPGAEKQELPYGGYIWMVPQDAPKPTLKPGPKAKSAGDTDAANAEGDQQTSAKAVSVEKPASKSRKAEAKKVGKKAKKGRDQ